MLNPLIKLAFLLGLLIGGVPPFSTPESPADPLLISIIIGDLVFTGGNFFLEYLKD